MSDYERDEAYLAGYAAGKAIVASLKNETAWVIEAVGPCWLGLREWDGHLFWTKDSNEAMRFSREQDAAAAQRIFQRLCPDLFPGVYPYPPRPIKHGWNNRPRTEDFIQEISLAEVLDQADKEGKFKPLGESGAAI